MAWRAMILVDRLYEGPEVGRTPAAIALDDLARTLRDSDSPASPSLEFFFVVGGSLGEPDFEGARVTVASPARQRLRIVIGIPSHDAREINSRDILLDLALQGMTLAKPRASWFPFDQYEPLLASLRTSPSTERGATQPDPQGFHAGRGPGTPPHSDEAADETDIGSRVEVHIPLGGSIDVLYRVEASVGAMLEEHQIGHVDGNEIGEGEFVVFAETTRPDEALAFISLALRTANVGSGAFAVVLDAERRQKISLGD